VGRTSGAGQHSAQIGPAGPRTGAIAKAATRTTAGARNASIAVSNNTPVADILLMQHHQDIARCVPGTCLAETGAGSVEWERTHRT